MWHVYIIQSKNGNYYTGITTDLERRFLEHKSGKKGARFFHTSPASKILYSESVANRSQASKREHFIKALSRADKITLIQENK